MEARNVLLIEDEPVDAARVRRILRAKQPGVELGLEHVETLRAGVERLAQGDLDLVLLDLQLPDSQGIDSLVQIREADPAMPVVVFTGSDDDETASAALAAGAQDYLVKDDLEDSLLRHSIHYAIERSRIAQDSAHVERRLHQVERMESLGVFCAGIGWGFNTVIGTIFDRCEHALASLDATRGEVQVRAALLEIHRAAFRAAEMVQRLRDYAAIERSASGRVDLDAFALEASDFLSTIVAPEIHVACTATGGPLIVEATRPELHRLLVSLVVNAAEAIGDERGCISISTGVLEADTAWLGDTHGWPDPKPGVHAFLRVADNGCGLAAEERERIFDPFYTSKQGGTGLGLALVRKVVDAHGGQVEVCTAPGGGTEFVVTLPRRGREPAERR